MSIVIVLTIFWAASLAWTVAVLWAAARTTPKPPARRGQRLCASRRHGRMTPATVRWMAFHRVLR